MKPGVRVLLLGAGAVGLSVAAKLSVVCTVHAVCRPASAKAIGERGFSLTGIWGKDTYRFSAADTVPAGTRYDYVIITSKSKDTDAVCRQFAPFIRDTETVSLQNGIGNEEIIGRYTDHVIGGMIITGFEWRDDASVHVSVEAGPAKLGRFPEGMDARIEELVSLIGKSGIPVEGSSSIRTDLWGKTLYNCALNPLGAVMGVPYGELAAPPSWRIISGIVREAFAVVAAEGVQLPWSTADDYLAFLHDVQLPATARHHSSMLQDLSRGRTTEIGFLNGAVVEKGRAHAIPTPCNDFIVDLIRFRESLAGREERP
jgi:2-dehydropantoate 2-reductase